MDGDNLLMGYDRGLTTSGSANPDAAIADQNDVGSSVEETSGALVPASSTAAGTSIQSTTTVLTPAKDGSRASRAIARQRGRPGKKWVKTHYEIIEHLTKENNGILPDIEALRTSPFPNSDKWSQENLPEILFYLKPPASVYEGQPVELLRDDNGALKLGDHGKPIREFPILPRHISCTVEGWLVEAWRRIDPRITYTDILDRQTEDDVYCIGKLDKNALQNRCRRECRMALGCWTEGERRDEVYRTDVEVIERLSYQNITLNTILDVCPARQDRLTKVRLVTRSSDGQGKLVAQPFDVDSSNVYETTFPIDYFVLTSEVPPNGLHIMDNSMMAAWELCLILQERARLHGASSWSKLADKCRPAAWFDRTNNKRVENETYDGGCSVCTWVPGRDQILHKKWMDEVKSACSKPGSRKSAAKSGANSGTSKKRKLANGESQAVPADAVPEPSKECECCKQADCVHSSGMTDAHQAAVRVQLDQAKSYYRDSGRFKKDHQAGGVNRHATADKEGGRNAVEQNARQQVELGTVGGVIAPGDWEAQVSAWRQMHPASPQKVDRASNLLTNPVRDNSNTTTRGNTALDNTAHDNNAVDQSRFSNTDQDLQGVGSHLTMGGGEQPPTHTQDKVPGAALQEANVEHDGANWPTIKFDLPVGHGADWTTEDDLEAQWWTNPQSAPSFSNNQVNANTQASGAAQWWTFPLNAPSVDNNQVNASTQASDVAQWWTNYQDAPSTGNNQVNASTPAATQNLNERGIDSATWPNVSEHHAADFRTNDHSRPYLRSDTQSYPQSGWDPKTSQQGMQGLWTRDQLTATKHYGPVQDQSSMGWGTTPELTTGDRTESFVSDNNAFANPTMSGRVNAPGPEEMGTMTSFGGYPTIDDTTTQSYTPNMIEERSSADEPAFNKRGGLFDVATYQNQFEMPDDSTSVHPSRGPISPPKALPNQYSMNTSYEYDLPDADPPANDGSFNGYT